MAPRIPWGRIWLYGVFATLATIGVIVMTSSRQGETRPASDAPDTTPPVPGPSQSLVGGPPEAGGGERRSVHPATANLTPVDVIGNPDCVMKPGAKHGRDLAMVVVLREAESRFAVVDGSGVVFGDTLPFRAVGDSSVARREDGSVLAGFGGSDAPRRDSGFRRAVNGVVVYQDGQIIYENEDANGFGLADDGSSFYVTEPMAGGVFRLAIRNLDLGIETHHDLPNLQTANEGAYRLQYSIDQSEVVIQPFLFFGGSRSHQYGFYPTEGSEPRHLSTTVRGFPRFVSSNEGYFLESRNRRFVTVSREYRYESEEVSVVERWSRDLTMATVSDDGNWLVGRSGTTVHVLNASTGETVFVHSLANPTGYSSRIHDGRLVLGHEVGDPEDIARCQGKREVEVVNRTPEHESDGALTVHSLVNVTGEKACFADLRERGRYRTVYDVYDLRTLSDGNPPDHYRVEYGDNPHCGSGDDPFGTLQVRDDQLVYVPRT